VILVEDAAESILSSDVEVVSAENSVRTGQQCGVLLLDAPESIMAWRRYGARRSL
jgi:hypothetical protein